MIPTVSRYIFGLCFPCCIRKCWKQFTSLGTGIITCMLAVVCLLIIDISGHAINMPNSNNDTQCVFQVAIYSTQ